VPAAKSKLDSIRHTVGLPGVRWVTRNSSCRPSAGLRLVHRMPIRTVAGMISIGESSRP
jgi:hypothetical protein